MKLRISPKPAAFSACAAMAARVFCGLSVDCVSPGYAAWLSAIIGAALSVPVLWMYGHVSVVGGRTARTAFQGFILAASLTGSAVTMADIAQSAGYLALDRVAPAALLLPAALALFWCVTRNGDSIGYAAMIWARLFALLLLIVVILQSPYYRPEWLRPILGSGWSAVARNAVRAAGWFCTIGGIWIFREDGGEGRSGKNAILLSCAVSGAIAALLLALHAMLAPAFYSGAALSWQLRLDALLTNGRTPLYLQMPMIILWYGGLFHLLGCEGFAAAMLLQQMAPRLDGRVCAGAVTLCASALELSGFTGSRLLALLIQYQYIAAAGFCAIVAARGGLQTCADA